VDESSLNIHRIIVGSTSIYPLRMEILKFWDSQVLPPPLLSLDECLTKFGFPCNYGIELLGKDTDWQLLEF
jgi:hypothetical protein